MNPIIRLLLLTSLSLGLCACAETPAAPLPTPTPIMAAEIYNPTPEPVSTVQWAAPSIGSSPVAKATDTVPASSRGPVRDTMGMTIWTDRRCDECHGVFAQGGPDAPALAGLNDPLETELARMRRQVDTIPEHGLDHISDEVFATLYEWLKMGCVRDECYH